LTYCEKSNLSFRCRTAGVLIHDRAILLQGEPQRTFWTLPGGGIELLEPSHVALQREMQEELGISVQIERLLWVVEHFFVSDDGGKAHHGIGFYYLITPLETPHLYHLERTIQAVEDGGIDIIFRWFKLDELKNIALYPAFLPTALQVLPLVPEHVVFDEITQASQKARE
jgi:8-oxo-dGTP pyrophosphatase MutT (NUDIX family)